MLSLQTQAEAIAASYTPPDVGRPSDIGDATLLKQFFAAIEDGNYMETACDLVGLSHVTVINWRKRGEAGEAPFDKFVTALKAASARAEARMVANVRKASDLPQFWAAGMTHLERRHPDRWGKRQDDALAPKVIVQVGGQSADVKVLVVSPPTFAPDSQQEDTDNSLTGRAYAVSSSPITAVMVTNPEPIADRATEANSPVAAHGSPGGGVGRAHTPRRYFSAPKGVSKKKRARRARRAPVKGDETA